MSISSHKRLLFRPIISRNVRFFVMSLVAFELYCNPSGISGNFRRLENLHVSKFFFLYSLRPFSIYKRSASPTILAVLLTMYRRYTWKYVEWLKFTSVVKVIWYGFHLPRRIIKFPIIRPASLRQGGDLDEKVLFHRIETVPVIYLVEHFFSTTEERKMTITTTKPVEKNMTVDEFEMVVEK